MFNLRNLNFIKKFFLLTLLILIGISNSYAYQKLQRQLDAIETKDENPASFGVTYTLLRAEPTFSSPADWTEIPQFRYQLPLVMHGFTLELSREIKIYKSFTTTLRLSSGGLFTEKGANHRTDSELNHQAASTTSSVQGKMGIAEATLALNLNFYAKQVIIRPFIEGGIGASYTDYQAKVTQKTLPQEKNNLPGNDFFVKYREFSTYHQASMGFEIVNHKAMYTYLKGGYYHFYPQTTKIAYANKNMNQKKNKSYEALRFSLGIGTRF